jgi:hypothetical protein
MLDRELQREKVWSRIHLVPLLLAEGDRDAYRRHQAAVAREAEIMKDVPGWEVSDCLALDVILITDKLRPVSCTRFHYRFSSRAKAYTTTQSIFPRSLSLFCNGSFAVLFLVLPVPTWYATARCDRLLRQAKLRLFDRLPGIWTAYLFCQARMCRWRWSSTIKTACQGHDCLMRKCYLGQVFGVLYPNLA